MGKDLTSEDYIRALYINAGKAFVYLDDQGFYRIKSSPDADVVQLKSKSIDPEKALIKKQAVDSLSEEAKEVIDIILGAPSETLRLLSTPTGRLTKRSIRIGLQKLWHSKFIAKTVIEELTKWARQL
jgi:hypothetical protein